MTSLLFKIFTKKRPDRVNLLEMYQGSLQLEAEGRPTPDTNCALLAIRFQSPNDKEIHATDRIAEAPHLDYITETNFIRTF